PNNFAACTCQKGMLWTHQAEGSVLLTLGPFDVSHPIQTFILQWARATGSIPDLIPWALCSTPDGSTFVVVAQESSKLDAAIDSTFGWTHVLVYRNPGGISSAPSAWHLEQVLDLNLAPTATWDSRYAAVDPSGHVLLYVTANGGAKRFSLADGKLLGSLPL